MKKKSGRTRFCLRTTQRTEEVNADEDLETGSLRIKTGFAEMLKGGVILDVTTVEHVASVVSRAPLSAVRSREFHAHELRVKREHRRRSVMTTRSCAAIGRAA